MLQIIAPPPPQTLQYQAFLSLSQRDVERYETEKVKIFFNEQVSGLAQTWVSVKIQN